MSNRRVAVLLALTALALVGPFVASDNAQPASRYSLTAALAEHRSIDIGPYAHELGVDRAIYHGHLRSDKAPGQPIVGVPAYVVGRLFGAESASQVHVRADLGLWWQTFWSATVPFAILLALMFLACTRFARRGVALAVTIAFGCSTMLLPFSVNLFGHDLAALFGFGGWLLIAHDKVSPRHAALAGALGGLAILTELQAGIIVVMLAGYLVVHNRARIGWYALGAAAPLGVLAWYQWAAFGAPWRTPSAFFAGTIKGETEGGYTIPGASGAWNVIFGERGLWIGAPVALVAIAAAVWVVRTGSGAGRRHAVVGLAIIVPYLVLCAGWSGFALLEDPGPRFLIPALPFLAVPLAIMWDRLWIPAILFSAWGALIAIPATVSFLLLGIEQQAVPELPKRVIDGEFLPTIWSMALGRAGVVLHLACVAVAIGLLVRAFLAPPDPPQPHDELPPAAPIPVRL